MDYSQLPEYQNMGAAAQYSATASPEMSGAMLLVITLLGVALYVYSAWCLYNIAKKTNTPNEWMAWIPIANLVLMVQIARLPLWWALGFLLAFIPVVNLLTIGLLGYIWWKIAEERRRPGWWGILMLIGPINLVLIYFLAFKEAPNQIAPTQATPPQAPSTPAQNS